MKYLLKKNNFLLLVTLLILLSACHSKKYYTLGNTIEIQKQETLHKNIDVLRVNVPKYLKNPTLVRQITPYQVEVIEKAQWLTPMQKRLTNILIDYLQKSLNNPDVHLYPWESSKNAQLRIAVTIKRFISFRGNVILEANYKIHNLETKEIQKKLFHTKVKIDETLDSMMEGMEKAYLQLIEKIKEELLQ